jgi:hypothetical protein
MITKFSIVKPLYWYFSFIFISGWKIVVMLRLELDEGSLAVECDRLVLDDGRVGRVLDDCWNRKRILGWRRTTDNTWNLKQFKVWY